MPHPRHSRESMPRTPIRGGPPPPVTPAPPPVIPANAGILISITQPIPRNANRAYPLPVAASSPPHSGESRNPPHPSFWRKHAPYPDTGPESIPPVIPSPCYPHPHSGASMPRTPIRGRNPSRPSFRRKRESIPSPLAVLPFPSFRRKPESIPPPPSFPRKREPIRSPLPGERVRVRGQRLGSGTC